MTGSVEHAPGFLLDGLPNIPKAKNRLKYSFANDKKGFWKVSIKIMIEIIQIA
jgi:hypothetical protein